MTEEWVLKRAEELKRTFTSAEGALWAMIETHEEPPVDPLLIEAREICAKHLNDPRSIAFIREGDWDEQRSVQAVLAALKRGIEIGEAK